MTTKFIPINLDNLDPPPAEFEGSLVFKSFGIENLDLPPDYGPATMIEEDIIFFTNQPSPPAIPFGIKYIVVRYLSIRVYFTTTMLRTTELSISANYTIDPIEAEALQVVPELDVEFPEYVDITMTDMKDGKRYLLIVAPDKLQSFDGTYLTDSNNTYYFDGVSEAPIPLFITPLSPTSIKVTFSKPMAQNDDLFSPIHYEWTHGLVTLHVEPDTLCSVILTTSIQEPNVAYELTVT